MKKRYEKDELPEKNQRAREEVARQMKNIRKNCRLTQQDVAERAQTQKSNISRMESGRYNPTLDFMVKVAGSMGKEVHIFIE